MPSIAQSLILARTENVLAYLPITHTSEYAKGQVIYGPDGPSASLYLVASGKAGVSRIAHDGTEVLLDIIRPDELFGESAFLNGPHSSERAAALEKTTVMAWAISDLVDLVEERPRLAIALVQLIAQRNADLVCRVESFSNDSIEQRLARSLFRFSERLGTVEENGSVRMMPITHGMLASHVGTSREIVTHYMSKFRRQGHVTYSRSEIRLQRDALRAVFD